MHCSKCGMENVEGAKFCNYCGTNLVNESAYVRLSAKGKALRQLYEHFGADRLLGDTTLMTASLGDLLPDEKEFRFRMRYVMDLGLGKLYLAQLDEGNGSDEAFAGKALRLLLDKACLNEKASMELITAFDEMLGWNSRGCLGKIGVHSPASGNMVTQRVNVPSVRIAHEYAVGDTFTFGEYVQGEDETKKSRIEWIVLDRQGTKLLLISKYALDCRAYNEEYRNVVWEACTLRSWLNGTFIDMAFSAEEQSHLLTATVQNPNSSDFKTKGCNATQDKVFLLSIDEAKNYFLSDSVRACAGTSYAYARGANTGNNGNCWWWLRSPGRDQDIASLVNYIGGIDTRGNYVNSYSGAVRPAIWIKPESLIRELTNIPL